MRREIGISRKVGGDPLKGLASAAPALTGRPLGEGEIEQFRRYLALLQRWNRTHHLTGLGSPEAIVRGLFLDSLLFLDQLPRRRPLTLLDVGAGAGIPGVPLRIADPNISLTLIESRRKAISFLLALGRELGLSDVRIIEGRAEAVVTQTPELFGYFDAVVCRAVGQLDTMAETGSRCLRPGGVLIASGPPPGNDPGDLPPGFQIVTVPFPALSLSRVFLVWTRSA